MTWILYHIGEVAVSDHNGLAAAEGSSSRNLGEYAVSARSDLRSAANYAKAPVRSEMEAKP